MANSARDYMVPVQNVPAYGPPDMSEALFKMISGIPAQYEAGVEGAFKRGQMARTERLQQPIEGTDYSSLLKQLLSAKGVEAIPEVLPTVWKSEHAAGVGQPQPWDTGGSAPPDMQSAAPLQRAAERQGQATTSAGIAPDIDSQGNNRGPTNIRQIAINAGVDPETPGFADEFRGVGLDRPIHPSAAQAAAAKIDNLKRAGMFGPPGDDQATASFDQRFGAAQPGPPAGGAPMARPQPPGVGGLGVGGSPAAPTPGPSAGAGLVPEGWLRGIGLPRGYQPTALSHAKWLQAQAEKNADLGFTEAAKVQADHANKILDAIGAVDPAKAAFEAQKNINTKRTDQAFANAAAFRKVGQTAEDAAPQIAIAKRLVNSPGFNAGLGVQFKDTLSQLSASLFGDPNASTPSQFFDKLRGGTILNEIRSLSGSGAGVVRVPEMKFIDTMIAGRDMQPPSIRSAVEVEERMNKRMQAVYRAQQDYLQTHPQLDEGFDRVLTQLKERFPLFTEREMQHPDMLGAPSAPLTHSPQAAMQWASQMGIKPGDPVRTPPMPGHPYGMVVGFDPAAFK